MALSSTILLTVAASAVLIIPLLLGVYVVKTYLSYRRLQHIPGAWYTGVSSAWLAYHTLKCDVYLAMAATTEKYGSLARIAPNMVVTSDPELYKLIVAPRAPFLRGQWFEGMKLDPRMDNILSMTDEKAHADLRAKLMPGYTGKDVTTLEADMDTQILTFMNLIKREYVDNARTLDFATIVSYFTLDVLSQIAFGSVFGFMTNNRDMFDYLKTTEAFFPIMELGSNVKLVLQLLNSRLVQALAGPKASDKVGLGAIMGKAHEAIAERYDPDVKVERNDMLASFVKNGLTQVECETESIITILAGSDSTATALRVTFWHILSNPPAYAKLVREVEDAVESGRASHPVIKDVEAKKLPYLQACIKEGLRMFMPLNGLSTRVCPPQGYTWKGIHIPGGTEIGVTIYSITRRKDMFGPDADCFRPERFIEGPPARIKELERIQELCFGSGRTSCLGKGIALLQLGKTIFELLRRYDFAVVNPLEAVETKSSGVVLQKGMHVRAWLRAGEAQ